MSYHQKLQNVIEDQLSLAAIHYLRTHYQEAIDIYKKILLDNRLVEGDTLCTEINLHSYRNDFLILWLSKGILQLSKLTCYYGDNPKRNLP